ncbi:MAG TPA: hypothetical protein VKE98_00210 [Gemmataceae bacterium]|nr:hypothetical protein [Gemmataceae bacterium]
MEIHLVVLLAGSFVCLGMFAIVWNYRARGVRRLRTVLETYAEREIAHARRRKNRHRARTFSAANAVAASR